MKKRNKKRKIYRIIISLLLVIIVGLELYNIKILTRREKQIEFLRDHEIEITKYIKSQNSKIKTVEYDWYSVQTGVIGNGTPWGAGKVLTIEGKFNNIQDSNFYLQFKLNTSDKMPDLKNMSAYNSFRVGGKLYK